jgi:hypothetical protein
MTRASCAAASPGEASVSPAARRALLRFVLCERLVAGSEMTAFVGEAVAPPEDGAGLIVLDERGCRRSVEEGLA